MLEQCACLAHEYQLSLQFRIALRTSVTRVTYNQLPASEVDFGFGSLADIRVVQAFS